MRGSLTLTGKLPTIRLTNQIWVIWTDTTGKICMNMVSSLPYLSAEATQAYLLFFVH